MTARKTEFIATLSQFNRAQYFLILMVLCILVTIYTFWNFFRSIQLQNEYVNHASELRILSQKIANNATEAANGNKEAFALLDNSQYEFQMRWDAIVNGSPDTNLNPDSIFAKSASQEINNLDKIWLKLSKSVDNILNGQQTVLDIHDMAARLNKTIPLIQDENEKILKIIVKKGVSNAQVQLMQRQSLLAERILRNVNRIIKGTDSVAAAENFKKDTERFQLVLNAMLDGNVRLNVKRINDRNAVKSLANIVNVFVDIEGYVDTILLSSKNVLQVRQAAEGIFTDSQTLLTQATLLAKKFQAVKGGLISIVVNILSLVLTVVFLALMLNEFNRQIRARLATEGQMRQREERQNQKNQQAILRLLDELGDLAEGDLTVETTVTEDFTGAIADSINFTIDQLRNLVSTINGTAVKVSTAAQESRSTAMSLADASEHQAQEIAGASAAVNEMAISIDQVSANATESTSVAAQSVEIAKKGSDVVQATIKGMTTIREQIQETAKRIKRLGESSQEIGDIISLINDIADQTNILALNAAIQASMAGDAGRGFAVVADEVQRLAERAAAATKQIEALVRTIQTDTSEAVISMEHTTAEVVSGAKLAQDAGVALKNVENVSKNLAELIQNISNAARQQAASAGHISNTMHVIQEITSQTSTGTSETANSIGNLVELAVRMRDSVAGFKLPDQSQFGAAKASAEKNKVKEENAT